MFVFGPETDSILAKARGTGHFSRGTASKLYGLANFLEQGIYGRVGYGGLMAIKARQDENTTAMTPEIESCFEVIEAVMRFQPKRGPNGNSPFFAWSTFAFWQHQMQQLKQTIQDQVVSTSYSSNLTGRKSVTVLSQPIVQSSKAYGSLQRPTSPAGAFYGALRLSRATRPFSTSTWSLVSGQCHRRYDASERTFQQCRLSKARSFDPFRPVCTASPGLLGARLEPKQLGRWHQSTGCRWSLVALPWIWISFVLPPYHLYPAAFRCSRPHLWIPLVLWGV